VHVSALPRKFSPHSPGRHVRPHLSTHSRCRDRSPPIGKRGANDSGAATEKKEELETLRLQVWSWSYYKRLEGGRGRRVMAPETTVSPCACLVAHE
jgi:hypothetical protein